MSDNTKIQAFLAAGASVLEDAIAEARAIDPEGVKGLGKLLASGGIVRLQCSLAPSTGLAEVAVDIAAPNGETHRLMAAELHRQTRQ